MIFGHEVVNTQNSYFSSSNMDYDSISKEEIFEVVDIKSIPAPNGGPDQPEVQSFTPVGTSDMVDPFTGDFSYNIPLMDVDGYPINIAYNSGVTMDQEATWVGLGWNLNPGVINRAMRGLPDDFDGNQVIEKTMNLKPNWTLGGSVNVDFEFFGAGDFGVDPTGGSDDPFSVNIGLGLNYNNYSGYSLNTSLGFNLSPSNSSLSYGLGFNGSSQGGATLSPTLGFSFEDNDGFNNKLSLASPINSRAGWQQVSVSYARSEKDQFTRKKDNKQVDITKTSVHNGSYNFGMSTFVPSISMPMRTAGGSFSITAAPDFLGADVGASASINFSSTWVKGY